MTKKFVRTNSLMYWCFWDKTKTTQSDAPTLHMDKTVQAKHSKNDYPRTDLCLADT